MTAPAPPRGPEMDRRIAARRAGVVAERRQRRRRFLWSLGMLLAVVAGLAALARSPLLAVTEVAVVGTQGDKAAAALAASGVAVGDNLFAADVAAATERVRGLPWVADAEVVRRPPATVEVRVRPRKPFAVVRLAQQSWTLDDGGVVLSGGAPEGLVVVDAPSASLPPPGQAATDPAVVAALDFHRQLPEGLAADVRRYVAETATALRMEVEAKGGVAVWVRVGEAEQVERKAEAVQALLPQALALAGPDGPGVEEVDVRVPDKPVLVPRTGQDSDADGVDKGG